MKNYSFPAALIVAIVYAFSLWGVPARPGMRILSQPDGSEIELWLAGDEFYHQYMAADGTPYTLCPDGYFRPADRMESEARRQAAVARRRTVRRPRRVAGEDNFSQVPHVGTVHIPVILVQYSDYKFRDEYPLTTFTNFFTDNVFSARNYFLDQSDGKFDPRFDIYGPVTLGYRSQYGTNLPDGGDRGIGRMVAEACLATDGKIDFSVYDHNGDGECDVVIILYAGDGEASSSSYNAAEAIWPCQWDLETSDYGKALTLDDTKVNMFAVFNELNGENLKKIDGVGTFCHEFSHCLGLPDFYDTQYGPHFGMGTWSVMDHGSYNNDGYTPLGYSAYEKEYMGWIEIPEGKAETRYTLIPPTSEGNDPVSGNLAVRLTNPEDPHEYYILEARRKRKWDSYMRGEGMLITHFTYDAEAWEQNCVNDYDPQRATLIPADDSLLLKPYSYYGHTLYNIDKVDEMTDLWPQEGADRLTDTSVPAAKVNTGGFMSKPVIDITRNDDCSVSFMTGEFRSGIKSPDMESGEESDEWITLQGLILPSKPVVPGLYIHRKGGETGKVMIR